MAPITQPQETTEISGGRGRSSVAVRTLRLAIEHYASGSSSEALDAQLEHAVSRLANSRLGGLAHHVTELATQWEVVARETDYQKATQIWAVVYQTAAGDMRVSG